MASLDQLKQEMIASGEWLFDGDLIPQDTALLLLVAHRDTGLDQATMVEQLKQASVAAEAVAKRPTSPHVYPFIISKYGALPTTVDYIKELFGAEMVTINRHPLPPEIDAEVIAQGRELAEPEDADRAPILFDSNQPLPTQTWVMLKVFTVGQPAISTNQAVSALEEAGYSAFAAERGISGWLVPAKDWQGGDWSIVLLNVGSQSITPTQLRTRAFDAWISPGLGWNVSVGAFTNRALTGAQGWMDIFYNTRKVDKLGKDTFDGVGAVADFLGDVLGNLRYLLYGGAAILGAAVLWRLYRWAKGEK